MALRRCIISKYQASFFNVSSTPVATCTTPSLNFLVKEWKTYRYSPNLGLSYLYSNKQKRSIIRSSKDQGGIRRSDNNSKYRPEIGDRYLSKFVEVAPPAYPPGRSSPLPSSSPSSRYDSNNRYDLNNRYNSNNWSDGNRRKRHHYFEEEKREVDTVLSECTRLFKLSGTTVYCSKEDINIFLSRCSVRNYMLTPILSRYGYGLTRSWLIGFLPPNHRYFLNLTNNNNNNCVEEEGGGFGGKSGDNNDNHNNITMEQYKILKASVKNLLDLNGMVTEFSCPKLDVKYFKRETKFKHKYADDYDIDEKCILIPNMNESTSLDMIYFLLRDFELDYSLSGLSSYETQTSMVMAVEENRNKQQLPGNEKDEEFTEEYDEKGDEMDKIDEEIEETGKEFYGDGSTMYEEEDMDNMGNGMDHMGMTMDIKMGSNNLKANAFEEIKRPVQRNPVRLVPGSYRGSNSFIVRFISEDEAFRAFRFLHGQFVDNQLLSVIKYK